MRNILIVLSVLLLVSCKDKSANSSKFPAAESPKIKVEKEEDRLSGILQKEYLPSDFLKSFKTDDGLLYSFWKIDSDSYYILKQKSIKTQLPSDSFSNFASVNDSCIIIKFNDGHIDTLMDRLDNQGLDYTFSHYSLKNNYFIISYFDSEAVFYELFSLDAGGEYYGLYTNQELSPNGNILVSFSDVLTNPLSDPGLFILRFDVHKILIDLDLSDTEWDVKEFFWVNDHNAILTLELFSRQTSEVKKQEYCLLKIE